MEGGFSSIEEVLATAVWVNSLTDASLSVTKLHETFTNVIFSFPADEDDDTDEGRTFLTAAEKQREEEREMREREKLRRELEELNAQPSPGQASDKEDEEGDEEDDDVDETNFDMDQDFLRWIDIEQAEEERPVEKHLLSDHDVALDLEMSRIGLGDEQKMVVRDKLPERLKRIQDTEKRPGLGSRILGGGLSYTISFENEAYWILRQLRRPGQPLAHNGKVCALANKSKREIEDEPILVAIAYALKKMTTEYLEPAALMLYHQSPLHPLLAALLEDSPLRERAEHSLPVSSYAYSTLTGRRQRPYVSEQYVGFNFIANRSIGEGDSMWRVTGADYNQRKPCFVELGRLLVRILELDSLCHKLEFRRQQVISALKDVPDSRVQDTASLLQSLVFESTSDAELWLSFAQHVASKSLRNSFNRIRTLGLEDSFEEYTITAQQYQDNLAHEAALHVCPSLTISVEEWSSKVADSVNLSKEDVLTLFNNAIAEQFSQLPLLCKKVVDLFCTQGDVIVSHKYFGLQDEIYPIAGFLSECPFRYMELSDMESNGSATLHYVVDESYVIRALELDRLYQKESNHDWAKERETAMALLVTKLMEKAIPQVKALLSEHANYCVDQEGVRRLATLCAQGPYEETQLRLEEYDAQRLTWEPEWNVVESLPTSVFEKGTRTLSRVCAAFRGTNGVTTFAFIDEYGSLQASLRWVDCALHTASGRSVFAVQNIQLEKLFLEYSPSVVAVAAFGSQSLGLMKTMQSFVKTRLNVSMHARVSLVWAPTEVARYCSETSYAGAELPRADSSTRTCVFLARYVQDPLFALSTLFDTEKTAVQLFSSCAHLTEQRAEEMYNRLCWEMSLWTSATGFWVEDCVKRPNSVALLQFVAGLGPFKGQELLQTLSHAPPSTRADVRQTLEDNFDRAVARNAVNSLLLAPQAPNSTESRGWNPLDATLIPLHWRPMVEFLSKIILDSAELGRIAALKLVSMERRERRSKVYAKDVATLLAQVRGSLIECRNEVGEREVELILDEIVSGTTSHLRRPFRKLSSHELMISVTGLTYVATEDGGRPAIATGSSEEQTWRSALILHTGDYVTGTVAGVRGSSNPGIRVLTSRGAGAFMPASSIADESLRLELLSYVRFIEQRRERRDAAQHDEAAYRAPAWLDRGAPIQGTVAGCLWAWCELRLDWCPPQTYDAAAEKTFDPLPSYNSAAKDNVSSVNSLKTVQIEQETVKFSTKISRHPFFRDVTSKNVQELLRDKEMGEVLLCPSRRLRNAAVCVVKVGNHSMCNWLVKEKRRQDGGIYYLLKDDVIEVSLEFTEVDELLSSYIQPLVVLTRSVRQHRRFLEHMEEVDAYFADASRTQGGLLYAFVETGKSSRPYCVITKGGERNHVFPLYFTSTHIYIRLPFVNTTRVVTEKWVKCENAETVSIVVKEHARALYTQNKSS